MNLSGKYYSIFKIYFCFCLPEWLLQKQGCHGNYCLWLLLFVKIAENVSLSLNFDRDNLSSEFMLILMKGVMPTVVDFSPPGLFRGSRYLQRKRISMLPGSVSGFMKARPRTTFWGSVTSLRYSAELLLKYCSDCGTWYAFMIFSQFF